MQTDDNCSFCRKFGVGSTGNLDFYDKILYERSQHIVIPGLGPFEEGYLMIMPKEHHLSISMLPEAIFEDFIEVKREVARVMAHLFGSCIFFEHGPALSTGGGGGSCIDHAHLHVLPTKVDPFPRLSDQHDFKKISNLNELRSIGGSNYIYYENNKGEMFVTEAQDVPGQYIRRVLAQELGIPEEWDYLAYPKYNLIKSTISKLSPWPTR